MGRDSIIQFYTTDENEEWLSEQAKASDQSLSEYCHEVIADHINREQERRNMAGTESTSKSS